MKYFLILYILLLTSCAASYIPPAPNIPLMSAKGDNNIALGASTNNLNLLGSYAISDKNALIGSVSASYGFFLKNDNIYELLYSIGKYDNIESQYKHWNAELGFGKYKMNNNNRVMELYSGFAYGHSLVSSRQTSNITSLFLQGNLGKKKKHAEFGMSSKVIGSYVNYEEVYYSGYIANNQFPVLTCQFSGLIKFGHENLKFWFSPGLMYSFVFADSHHNELGFVNNEFSPKVHLAFGINYTFNKYK